MPGASSSASRDVRPALLLPIRSILVTARLIVVLTCAAAAVIHSLFNRSFQPRKGDETHRRGPRACKAPGQVRHVEAHVLGSLPLWHTDAAILAALVFR